MRRLLIACALTLTSCATPAAYHVVTSSYQTSSENLAACVVASDDRATLERCQGLIARACIEAEGAGTISDVLCWDSEAAAWRELIDINTARIDAADAEKGARLRSANEAWSAWLDSECEYRAYEFGGGSGEQVDRVSCAADLTAARAIDLIAPR